MKKTPNKFDLIFDEVMQDDALNEGAIQAKIDNIVKSEQQPEPAARPDSMTINGSDVLSIKYNQCDNYKNIDLMDAYKIIASVDDVADIIKARTEVLLYVRNSLEDDIFTNRLRTIMNLFGILKNGILNNEVGANGSYHFDVSEYLDEDPESIDVPTDTETNIDRLVFDYAKNKQIESNKCLMLAMITMIKAADRDFHNSLITIKSFMNFPAAEADLLEDEDLKVLELVEILRAKIEKSAV